MKEIKKELEKLNESFNYMIKLMTTQMDNAGMSIPKREIIQELDPKRERIQKLDTKRERIQKIEKSGLKILQPTKAMKDCLKRLNDPIMNRTNTKISSNWKEDFRLQAIEMRDIAKTSVLQVQYERMIRLAS